MGVVGGGVKGISWSRGRGAVCVGGGRGGLGGVVVV